MSAATTLLSLAGLLGAAVFVLLIFAFNTSFLVVMANSASLVIDPHRDIAGFASSAFGFFTQIVSSALALATMPLFQGRLLPWAMAMLLVMGTIFIALTRYQRQALKGAVANSTKLPL